MTARLERNEDENENEGGFLENFGDGARIGAYDDGLAERLADADGGGLVAHLPEADGGLVGRMNADNDGDNENEEGGSFLENVGEGVGAVAGGVAGAGLAAIPTAGFGAPVGGIVGKEVGETVGGAVGGAVEDAGKAVGNWAMDNAGHLADASLTFATGGAYLWVDAATGGLSELQNNVEEKQQAEEQRRKKFDEASKNLEGNGAVGTSDELLDDGKHGLEFFAKFLPIYSDWTGGGPDYEGEIVEEFDQLREIDFGAFREDARRLEGVHGVLLDQTDTMNQAFQSAKQTWKGQAADSAGAKVGTFTGGGTTLANETEALGGAITPAVDGIQQAVREYSKFVLDLGKDLKCADKSPEEAKDEVRKARGDLQMSDLGDVGIDDVFSGAWAIVKNAAIGFILGGPIGGALGQLVGAADAAGEIRQGIIDDAKKWLDTAFTPEFDTKHNEFKQQSTGTQDTVQQAYDQLLQKTELTDDPFAGLNEGGDGSNGSGQQSTNPSAQQVSGDSGGGGGGGSAGGGGGGGAMPPGGGSATPPGGGGATPPEAGDTGPGQPGGGGSNMPGAEPDTPGAEQDTVSLGNGDDKVTVAEPNEEGTTEVTVIGQDGQPKTYEVAFGEGQEDSASGELASGGRGPGAGSIPGETGAGPAGAGAGQAGAEPGRPGESHERITPDEDGKAVIREGDRTITLQQGEDGELQVSVDNGDGRPPAEQTVAFSDDAGPAGAGMPGTAPDADPGSTPPGSPHPDQGVAGAAPAGGIPGGEGAPLGAAGADQSVGTDAQGGVAAAAPSAAPSMSEPQAPEPSVGAAAAGGVSAGVSSAGLNSDDASTNGPATTTSQAASYTNIGTLGPDGNFTPAGNGSFASMSGQLGEEQGASQDRQGPSEQPRGDRNTSRIASMGDAESSTSHGSTGIASMDDSGGGGNGGGSGEQRSGGGGMMGMGGMGGMGGQQGGGDQERSSQWRSEGQLFDDLLNPSSLLGMRPEEDEKR